MSLIIEKISKTKYNELVKNIKLPLWTNPLYIDCYKLKLLLIARDESNLKGLWVVPQFKNEDQLMAEREFRFFPYSSPVIFETDNLKRRKIVFEFFKYIKSHVKGVSLPMYFDFTDFASIQSMGAIIEWRHTHILNKKFKIKNATSRLKNHLNHAKKFIKTEVTVNPNEFNFDIAIKGSSVEKEERSKHAKKLLKNKNAIIISAKEKNIPSAGLLLAYDNQTAYLMHSWQLPNTRRGTITLLITKAINWSFENKLKTFDFEGSVIQNIDYFFCGFNTRITPYGHIHWNLKNKQLFRQIIDTINIPGRIIDNEK